MKNNDKQEEIMDFNCPNCGVELRVKAEHQGKQSICPNCKNRIPIPKKSTR